MPDIVERLRDLRRSGHVFHATANELFTEAADEIERLRALTLPPQTGKEGEEVASPAIEDRLFAAIKHGDQKHQDWLWDAITGFCHAERLRVASRLRDAPQVQDGEAKAAIDESTPLPCDVLVAPVTIIRKGVPLSTLLTALEQRQKLETIEPLEAFGWNRRVGGNA